jgi:endogenous inhibitor of DNA gyrase (YacG/DUF329 family)
MMGFMTGISTIQCESCGKRFYSGATLQTHPYDDYECSCGWKGTLCGECAEKGCPKCGKKVESTYDKIARLSGGDVIL